MINILELRSYAAEGLDFICNMAGVKEAEVFIVWNEQMVTRINYTSDITCNGLQEPKSTEYLGVGVNVVFKSGKRDKIGFGYISNDISMNGIKEAFRMAKQNSIFDPEFKGLPYPIQPKRPLDMNSNVDINIMNISEKEFVELGWRGLTAAVNIFNGNGFKDSLIVGGDIGVLKEKVAIKNSNGIDDFDESTILTSNLTSMIEKESVKGTGWSTSINLENFRPEDAGRESAESAIKAIKGERIASGRYNVIFGKQAVADIFTHVLIPSLSLDAIHASNSPFLGKLGHEVGDKEISIYDDGRLQGEIGSRKITCEGLPTGRTYLIKNGILVGFLSNNYFSKVLSNKIANFEPRNGFRFSGRGRNYCVQPKIYPTNVVLEGRLTLSESDLLSAIKNGIYVGRIWYTYPVNGLAKGDFTSTIIGDSFIVENGKILRPLRPNVVRINYNVCNLLKDIIAVGSKRRSTIVWGNQGVIITPDIAVKDVNLENVSDFLN